VSVLVSSSRMGTSGTSGSVLEQSTLQGKTSARENICTMVKKPGCVRDAQVAAAQLWIHGYALVFWGHSIA
jgi:hypothetical protein